MFESLTLLLIRTELKHLGFNLNEDTCRAVAVPCTMFVLLIYYFFYQPGN